MTDAPAYVNLADVTPAIALTPLDGRYRAAVAPLVDHLSEAALNRARLLVEVEWLIGLCGGNCMSDTPVIPGAPTLAEAEKAYLRAIPATFGVDEIAELAEIERITVHDVKAIEYFIKRRLEPAALESVGLGQALAKASELTHFACTSEDINNLSYAIMIKGAVEQVWLPAATGLADDLATMAHDLADVPMLSRTHGQPATPTTLGKEIAVTAHRLRRQIARIKGDEILGKINGATGTYGAHSVAVPSADWPALSRRFVEALGLTWNPLTTQIESHDWQAEIYADIARYNRIAHNLATDVWTYISLGFFTQIPVAGAVGSSAMPHKINPIRFENAEANLEISNALLDTLSATLVTSRLQRDLTDSTTQRNIAPAFGHSLLALDNLRRGLKALHANAEAMAADLDQNWEVLAEPIQTTMRAASIAGVPGMDNPYETLKDLTRGHRVTAEGMREFVSKLGLPGDAASRLLALTPAKYTGLAAELVSEYLD